MKMVPHPDWSQLVATDQSGSVLKILDGTLRAIGSMGTRRLSMSDICESSGVSRGTLYRYFTSKEDVLAAVSEFVCSSFERGIVEAGEGIADPIERFRAVMRFYGRFTIERSPDGIFEVEPAFHLQFLRSHFNRHKAAVARANGVGPKLALRIVTELKGKPLGAGGLTVAGAAPGPVPVAVPSLTGEAIAALLGLGVVEVNARRAVDQALIRLGEGADLSAVIRAALQELGR